MVHAQTPPKVMPNHPVRPLPSARTMSVLAASKVLEVSRGTVERLVRRKLIEAEQNEHGHLLPLRASVERFKAEQDAAAADTAAA
ncbi:hypothetical protein tb265_39260 [Gemmatimonadetes bacterium T265]|nr:hypothetical protein tb265_39260 [Gemmatimonadetes bacterium T265]